MALGIDIVADGIRCSQLRENDLTHSQKYGVLGLVPRRDEPLVWNNPRALRLSSPGPYISLSQIWDKFMSDADGRTSWEWESIEGFADKRSTANLIVDSIIQNFDKTKQKRTIFSIDNTLNEFQQEALIKSLRSGGVSKSELLWRPIAIAMYYLNSVGRDEFDEGDRLIIADLDSYLPEVTVLNLKYLRDELVPVRDLPSKENLIDDVYSSYRLKYEFVKHITENKKDIIDQLLKGPFSNEFISFLEGKSNNDIWLHNGLSYNAFKVNTDWRNKIADFEVDGINFEELRDSIWEDNDLESDDIILWNGFPCRIQNSDIYDENEIVLPDIAVSSGAADYAQRREENRPTYLDTLPGLQILSEVGGTGHHKMFDVILKGEVEGGKTERIPKPLTQFKLEKDAEIFTSVLHNVSEGTYKKIETEIPVHKYDEDVPVIINAEMRPANGNALVTIEGAKDYGDVFGRQKMIKLDWRKMEDFEFDDYSGPEVYPVQGRIATDSECLEIAHTFVDDELTMNDYVEYSGHNVKYIKIHEPWGYYTPFGRQLGEPTRALFGAKEENSEELNELAEEISNKIYETVNPEGRCICTSPSTVGCRCSYGKRHQYLNYLFRYTPESFLEELRDIYSSENPRLSWNTVYGVGRTFYKVEDFELFVDFIIKKSANSGYPDYHDAAFAKIFFWSFFRPLCYYEDTIRIPIEKAEEVLRCIRNFVEFRDYYGRGDRNEMKFLLCTVLFSLRFRRREKSFLEIDSDLYNIMVETIMDGIPRTLYPKTMFSEPQDDYLNDYVYRFLSKEATEQDFGALKGLTTSMS